MVVSKKLKVYIKFTSDGNDDDNYGDDDHGHDHDDIATIANQFIGYNII